MVKHAFIIIVLVNVCIMENVEDKYTTVNVPHEQISTSKKTYTKWEVSLNITHEKVYTVKMLLVLVFQNSAFQSL